jgi:endonuclease/exonuclease/phosphatase family metal-dependent hydrolase
MIFKFKAPILILAMAIIGFSGSSSKASAQFYGSLDSEFLCIQNFNAYGPIYASNVIKRTLAFSFFLNQEQEKCDVLHFQEIWNQDQIKVVEDSLDSSFSISAPNKSAKIGLMSLFRGSVAQVWTYGFRINSEGGVLDSIRSIFNVKKAFHVAQVQLPKSSEEYYFVNTHLHPSSSAVRVTQILDILNWRLRYQDKKMILSGDFNADIGSLERQLLLLSLGVHDAMEAQFGGVYPINFCTYCVENPLGWTSQSYTFDYVLFSNVGSSSTTLNTARGQVNMKGAAGQTWSDHYGLRVHLRLLSNASEIERQDLEERRNRAIRVFDALADLLKNQNSSEFQVYEQELRYLLKQLMLRKGSFYEYFNQFR